MSSDPKFYLTALKQRNDELEVRIQKLNKLLHNLEQNISKVQLMYETMITSQENQCIDMVSFDEEYKIISKSLFPDEKSKTVKPRKRQENSNLILSHILELQRLPPKQTDEHLQNTDPLLKRVRQDIQTVQKFMSKYSSFLE